MNTFLWPKLMETLWSILLELGILQYIPAPPTPANTHLARGVDFYTYSSLAAA